MAGWNLRVSGKNHTGVAKFQDLKSPNEVPSFLGLRACCASNRLWDPPPGPGRRAFCVGWLRTPQNHNSKNPYSTLKLWKHQRSPSDTPKRALKQVATWHPGWPLLRILRAGTKGEVSFLWNNFFRWTKISRSLPDVEVPQKPPLTSHLIQQVRGWNAQG